MNQSVGALAFDLDDTLTDWWSAIRHAAHAVGGPVAAAELGRAVQERAWVRRSDGAVHREHWRLRAEPQQFWCDVRLDVERRPVEALTSDFEGHLRPRLYDDVMPFLDGSAELQLGVLSNSLHACRELRKLGIDDRFHCVVELDDPNRKPRLEGFSLLCEQLGREPGQVMYVGDSPTHDVEPALAAGLRAVWLNRFRDLWITPPPAVEVTSLAELSARLAR